ncbi:MAG: hypothetical protein ACRDJO_02005, partial [Actinomycetota bacterium]
PTRLPAHARDADRQADRQPDATPAGTPPPRPAAARDRTDPQDFVRNFGQSRQAPDIRRPNQTK